MEKEFVPYPLALRLKALGFDEPCFGYYDGNHNFNYMFEGKPENFSYRKFPLGHSVGWKSAPTFSQAFRWFRENHGLRIRNYGSINYSKELSEYFEVFKYGYGTSDKSLSIVVGALTYEEAELACLNKLIEIVESKSE